MLAQGGDEGQLYRLAVDTLIHLHRNFRPERTGIGVFDEARALREVELLLDWYWPSLTGKPADAALRNSYRAAWRSVLPARDAAPRTLALFDFHIDNLMLIKERARFARALRHYRGLDGLIAAVHRLLEVSADFTSDAAIAAACEDGCFDGPGLRRAMTALLAGGQQDQARGQAISDWLQNSGSRRQAFARYRTAFFTSTGEIRKSLISAGAASAAPGAQEALAAEADRLLALDDLCGRITVARATAALYRLADGILREYRRLKEERALLDYDDLILTARNLLKGSDIAPWVLYKLDGGIDHILIDEAQDTNPEQWEVVATLAQEFFAGEGARALRRTVFVVGDAKQSIFSFQRADSAAFQRIRQYFAERIRAAGEQFAEVPLVHSFRSAPAVLRAVDAVFARSPARDGVVPTEELLEHGGEREQVWAAARPPPWSRVAE